MKLVEKILAIRFMCDRKPVMFWRTNNCNTYLPSHKIYSCMTHGYCYIFISIFLWTTTVILESFQINVFLYIRYSFQCVIFSESQVQGSHYSGGSSVSNDILLSLVSLGKMCTAGVCWRQIVQVHKENLRRKLTMLSQASQVIL